MKQFGKKARVGIAFLLSFLIMALYFVVVYQKIPFIYDINDDVAMRNVAAGVITGEPDAHLIFVKYILGLVISGWTMTGEAAGLLLMLAGLVLLLTTLLVYNKGFE